MRYLRITATAASRDLERISEYFLERNVDAGDHFVQTFNQKCQLLARFPYIGKSYARLRPGLRGLLMMDYIVFYQIVEDNVEILRVISGYRDLRSVFPNN